VAPDGSTFPARVTYTGFDDAPTEAQALFAHEVPDSAMLQLMLSGLMNWVCIDAKAVLTITLADVLVPPAGRFTTIPGDAVNVP
jgi:hypothetical protein